MEARSNNLDLIRLLLASTVIFSHCFVFYGLQEPLMQATHLQMSFGKIAVCLFFFISGMLVTQSRERSKSVWQYLAKRARRLYPGFLVEYALGIALFGWLASGMASKYWAQLANLVGWHRIVGYGLLLDSPPGVWRNHSLWSIPWEAACYLVLAFFWWIGIHRRREWVVAVWLGLNVAFAARVNIDLRGINVSPELFIYFFGGSLVYLYRDKMQYSPALAALALAALLVAAPLHVLKGVAPVALTYLTAYAAFALPKRIALPADVSYGVYLYGWPVQEILARSVLAHAGPLTLFLAAWPASLFCGLASWVLVERRWLRRGVPASGSGALSADEQIPYTHGVQPPEGA